jgi:hypothetical protein
VNERAVDFAISAGAALLGLALLAAAVLRLTEPIAPQIAALPADIHVVRAQHAVSRPRVTLRIPPLHRATIAVKRTPARPIALAPIAVEHGAGPTGARPVARLVAARPMAATVAFGRRDRALALAQGRLHRSPQAHYAHIAAVDAKTLPEPPIGYDPEPALAAPDIGVVPPAIDTTDLPDVLVARRHRR